MSFVKCIQSDGYVAVIDINDMLDLSEYLLEHSMSFKVMFMMDGSALFFLVEEENQK